jgi:hypothetical protein
MLNGVPAHRPKRVVLSQSAPAPKKLLTAATRNRRRAGARPSRG